MNPRSPSLNYENKLVRCKATRNIPEIDMVGFKLESVETNEELNTYYWVARELAHNGFIEYVDVILDNNQWTQVHFKERINPAGPPNPLPDEFYTKAYQSFKSMENTNETFDINRIRARYRDILESRINRITRLASAEAISPTRLLQSEELCLYENIHRIVSEWRENMRKIGGE